MLLKRRGRLNGLLEGVRASFGHPEGGTKWSSTSVRTLSSASPKRIQAFPEPGGPDSGPFGPVLGVVPGPSQGGKLYKLEIPDEPLRILKEGGPENIIVVT